MRSLSILLTVTSLIGPGHAFADDADFAPRIYATRADGSPAWELATLQDYVYASSPEMSPDGSRVAFDGIKDPRHDRGDSHIAIVNLNDGSVEDLGRGAMPSWSADGTWLAYSRYTPDQGVYIRSIAGGSEELIEAFAWGIQWSPDGKRLAYARGGNLIIYDLATKTKHTVFPENRPLRYEEIYGNCGWSADSKRICFKARRRPTTELNVKRPGPTQLAIVPADGEPELKVCFNADAVSEDVAWHPDGARIVMPMAQTLYEFDPDAKSQGRPIPGLPANRTDTGACWSRNGEILVFIGCRPGLTASVHARSLKERF
jgi:Tol biopolymer transport system component